MNFFAPITAYPALTCAALYMDRPVKLDDLWVALCTVGAVYFLFRG